MDGHEFAGRVALVTGAGKNIGLGIARRLALGGASVVVLDHDGALVAAATDYLTGLGASALGVVGDVTDSADFARAVTSAESTFGSVNILVNNAGLWITKPFVEHTEQDFDRVLATNVRGVFIGARAVLPGMIEHGWGRIVNITSIGARNYTVPHFSYSTAKAAVNALTRDLAVETAEYGITVNAVAPGLIRPQDFVAEPGRADAEPDRSPAPGLPLGLGVASDVADAVAYLASDGAAYVTGHVLSVAGGSDLSLNMLGHFQRRRDMVGQHF